MPKKRFNDGIQRLPPADQADAAAYIGALTGELATIARRHNFEVLTYLLEMAHREADSVGQPPGGSS